MDFILEARGGIEPPIKVLQTFALPLGDRASFTRVIQGAHLPGAEQLPHDRSLSAQSNDCKKYSIITVTVLDENLCGVVKK
jgi:hypothetical protein